VKPGASHRFSWSARQLAVDDVQVGSADGACSDSDQHLRRAGIREFGRAQRRAGPLDSIARKAPRSSSAVPTTQRTG
jgi:hypothetical protein